jgi:DNA-binding winged helix-turn-helix (wHTH) protein
MSSTTPSRRVLTGVHIGLLIDDASERSPLEAALGEQGATTEHLRPELALSSDETRVDVAVVRGPQRSLRATRPIDRQRLTFIDALARTERVVALLDEPPEASFGATYEFVLPPFRPAEVVPRVIRALTEPRPSPVIQIGNLHLNVASRTVTVDGRVIALTFTEFEIVRALLSQNGGVVAREELDRRLGADVPGQKSRRIDIHVHRLRTKLRGLSGARLETVRNVGYRFTSGPPDTRAS